MDAKKPLISVIVPVYNVEKYLPKCRTACWPRRGRSLRSRGGRRLPGQQLGHHAGIRPAGQPRPAHPAEERRSERGPERRCGGTRGEWIGFLDSDDYVAPEMYERLYRAAVEQGAQMAVCSFTYVTPDGKPIPRTSPITKMKF